ncbi:hypothetical protein QBC41DRAFT_399056 [Cercophora samala]|uniref:NECAP PHear domain-containing protein n=1 Tax=Cercophora samala TaxID=330535 RepID=A0AA40D7T7_9PEZI|nr:hypothetical protein QBC41DRAFT_399056 [Cercophora samala]
MDPTTIDPATGQPLPPDAIVRVLHITNKVHIYTLPPTTPSSSTYLASSWTSLPQNPIFTSRLRILETSLSPDTPELKVDILLESTTSSSSSESGQPQLFAAAPYTTPAIVTPCSDSSRFFALRVSDPSTGKKASLGIGFEERSDAFDFNLALQECGKSLGFAGAGGQQQQQPEREKKGKGKQEERKDWSLKEGETITINLGGKFGRRQGQGGGGSGGERKQEEEEGKSLNSFALPPPPGGGGGGGGGFSLPPPPPSASEARRQKRLSAQQMGFDDGVNGEFA